jgi:DNA-binding HxlR family transcriptional regulator
MSATMNGEQPREGCNTLREILGLMGDRWTAPILGTLGDRRMRFNELHRAVEGISQRMLTVTLRNLERDGFLVRTVYPTIPPRVEYELSERGRSLKEVLGPVGAWVVANEAAIEESRRRFDREAREEATPTLIKW